MHFFEYQKDNNRTVFQIPKWHIVVFDISEHSNIVQGRDMFFGIFLPPWWRDATFLAVSIVGMFLLIWLLDSGFPIRGRLG